VNGGYLCPGNPTGLQGVKPAGWSRHSPEIRASDSILVIGVHIATWYRPDGPLVVSISTRFGLRQLGVENVHRIAEERRPAVGQSRQLTRFVIKGP